VVTDKAAVHRKHLKRRRKFALKEIVIERDEYLN